MGLDADAVVGKDGVGLHLFSEGDLDGTERDRQIGRNGGGDAEAMRGVNDGVNADVIGQAQRRNVT